MREKEGAVPHEEVDGSAPMEKSWLKKMRLLFLYLHAADGLFHSITQAADQVVHLTREPQRKHVRLQEQI